MPSPGDAAVASRPVSAGSTIKVDRSFPVQVQQARVEGYTIQVPLRLCQNDKTSLDSVFALVRQFHPQPDMLTAKTKMFTFESSEWTALNLQHLASQGNSYILLGEAVDRLPVERQFRVQALPASRVLTEPQPMPSIEGHLPPIFACPSEFIDNSLRALRESSSNKKISATFHLKSKGASSGTEGQAEDFIAFMDTGCGMTFPTLQHWCKLGSPPQEDAGKAGASGISPYFADGNLARFGLGSKGAGWTFGRNILIVTKPNVGVEDWRQRLVLEQRCNKAELEDQEHDFDGAFHFMPQTRQAGTDGLCRTEAEKANPELMKLIHEADKEEHFTLFIITGLYPQRVQQLLSKPFSTLCKMLKGMYFYYSVPGSKDAGEDEPKTTARANFMYGQGYKYGPVDIVVTGFGFRDNEDAHDFIEGSVSHSLSSPPWHNWPKYPPPSEDGGRYEDTMHKLARLTEKSTFTNPPKGMFANQVVGSKFVFGMIIKGGEQSDMPDVFVKGYLHYMPFVDGEYTKAALGLKDRVRWIAYWKGRQIPFADIYAMLPFMEKSMATRPAAYGNRLKEQVVGQLFFQSVTGVDQYKTRFSGAINDEFSNLDKKENRFEWFHVVESQTYNSAAYDREIPATGLTRGSPGLNPTNVGKLAEECGIWVEECYKTFDEKYMVGAELEEKSQEGMFKAYKSLRAAHLKHTFSSGDVVLAKNMKGGKLSHYTYVQGSTLIPVNMQTVLCRVQYFKVEHNHSDNEAVAVVTREPSSHFGSEEFEVEAHKLSSKEDELRRKKEDLDAAMDFTLDVSFSVAERVAKSNRRMHVKAGEPLPHAEVKVFNRSPMKGTQRTLQQIVQWTTATQKNRRENSVSKLLVKQHIVQTDGGDVAEYTAEFTKTGHIYKFEFSTRGKPIALSQPGGYTTWFTAQSVHQDGAHSPPKTTQFQYIVECGDVTSCQWLLGNQTPSQPLKLHSQLPSMVVQLLDDQKNTYGGNSARLPKISYACPKLHVNPVAGQSARWETVDGVHLLKLPLLVITPNTAEEGLRIGHADQSVKCEVTVGFSNLSRHQSPTAQVSINFVVNVVSGPAVSLRFKSVPAYFSVSDEHPAERFENQRACLNPDHFEFELLDGDGYRAACNNLDSPDITASVMLAAEGIGHKVAVESAPPMLKRARGTAKIRSFAFRVPSTEFQAQPLNGQGLPVRLRATWGNVAPLEFRALVMPSSTPSMLRVFRTMQDPWLLQPLPLVEDPSDGMVTILHQPAGTEVWDQLAITLNNEAGPLGQPQIGSVRIRNQAQNFSMSEHVRTVFGVRARVQHILLCPGPECMRLPTSLEPRDRELVVSGVNGTWTCRTTIRLQPTPGPAYEWVLKLLGSQDQGDVMNSENLAMRVVGHLVDEYHNQCETLPASIDLHSNPPQLAVQHGQAAHPSARTNFKAADAHGRYNGRWTFLNGVLSMPDLALLGTPGQVQMTLSGGTRVTGGCITAHTLSLQLHPGSIAELRVSGWPPHSGVHYSHEAVSGMSLTLHDEAGNALAEPPGKLYAKVLCEPASATACCFGKQKSSRLPMTAKEGRLQLDPFKLVSTQEGLRTWRLEIRRAPNVLLAECELDAFNMVPSPRIIKEIVLVKELGPEGEINFIVGRVPPVRFGFTAENGERYPRAFELASNVKARIERVGGKTVDNIPLNVCEVKGKDDTLECTLHSGVACTIAGEYEMLISYSEALPESLGLEPAEGSTKLTQRLFGKPGVPHSLSLTQTLSKPADATTLRTVLNAGSDTQRTIVSDQMLRIVDEYQNTVIQQGTAGSLHVTLSIQDDQKHPAVGFIIAPSSVDIPLAEGSVRFEPVLVQPGTTALEGSYGLRISADGLRRFRVPFRLRDAQGLTASVAEALAALNEATDEKLALDDARTGVKLAQKREALRKCQKELKAKQQYIPSNVAKGSLHQMQKQCQQHLDALRPARSEREHRMDQHPLHQQLLAVRGVMGFLHDFVLVEDDNDARLLSWMAKDRLQTLVVDTYETSEAVLRAYPAFTGRMLPLELADNLKPLILPHTGLTNVPLHANPRCFVDLVTAEVRPQHMPSSSAEQRTVAEGKLERYACQNLLRMDTAGSAAAYIKAVKAQKKPCPSMLCLDTGKFFSSSGEVSNARAPTTFTELLLYFDSLPKSKLPEGKKLQQAIDHLPDIFDLETAIQEAQAAYGSAERDVAAAKEQVRKRQKEYDDAIREQNEVLPPLDIAQRPPAADMSHAEEHHQQATAPSAGVNIRKRRQRGGDNTPVSHSPAMQSPVRRRVSRRTDNGNPQSP